jgi:hypothetical protein
MEVLQLPMQKDYILLTRIVQQKESKVQIWTQGENRRFHQFGFQQLTAPTKKKTTQEIYYCSVKIC